MAAIDINKLIQESMTTNLEQEQEVAVDTDTDNAMAALEEGMKDKLMDGDDKDKINKAAKKGTDDKDDDDDPKDAAGGGAAGVVGAGLLAKRYLGRNKK